MVENHQAHALIEQLQEVLLLLGRDLPFVVIEHDHVVRPVGDVLKDLPARLLRQMFVGDVVVTLKDLQKLRLVEGVTARDDGHLEFFGRGGALFRLGSHAAGHRYPDERQQRKNDSADGSRHGMVP